MRCTLFRASVVAGLIFLCLTGCGTLPEPSIDHDVRLHELTVTRAQALFASNELTAVDLTEYYLAQISEHNPRLNAVIAVNPNALSEAQAADAALAQGRSLGVLHGIPVLLKDNIETADPIPTTAGSLALAENFAVADAELVRRLRAAGAIILGKANLSEWANFRSTRSTSGWSSVGGQTRNPYDTDRNTCGSSSGSAVAVAADLTLLAIGTETDGSIICPASINGIVGIKPTLGRVSQKGIVPLAHSQDTAGAMARRVDDAALLHSVIADPPATETIKNIQLNGIRIGIYRDLTQFHPDFTPKLNAALDTLRENGAIIVDPVAIPTRGQFGDAEFEVLLTEFKHDLNHYLEGTPASVKTRSLKDLIAFNDENAEEMMPWFGQEIFHMAQSKGSPQSEAYQEALASSKRLAGPEGIDAAMAEHNIDVILAASNSPAWVIDPVSGDHYLGGSSSFAAVSGYPNVTVPLGLIHGLPVGVSLFAGFGEDDKLIAIAKAWEQLIDGRKSPMGFKASP